MRAATLALFAERARICPFRHVGEPLGAAAQGDGEGDDRDQADRAEADVDRRAQLLERLLPVVAEQAEDGRPPPAAGRVPGEEALPLHLPDASEEGGVRAEDRDEATEEDDLPAMAVEHVARDLQVA